MEAPASATATSTHTQICLTTGRLADKLAFYQHGNAVQVYAGTQDTEVSRSMRVGALHALFNAVACAWERTERRSSPQRFQ